MPVPKTRITKIDGVEFSTEVDGPAITTFTSKSEDTPHVLQAVAKMCEQLAGGGGSFDYNVRFNIASCPNDYIRGTIEWIGF